MLDLRIFAEEPRRTVIFSKNPAGSPAGYCNSDSRPFPDILYNLQEILLHGFCAWSGRDDRRKSILIAPEQPHEGLAWNLCPFSFILGPRSYLPLRNFSSVIPSESNHTSAESNSVNNN